jgi:hypothetical protein
MRPKVATCLSLVAVLGAGALAAAANLRVFADPAPEAGASEIGTSPSSAVDVDAIPATGAAAAAGTTQTFTLGPAGSLTLGTTGGLHVEHVDPAPGWQATTPTEPHPPGTVVVAFHPPAGPTILVTAVTGPDGIQVAAHEQPAAVTQPVDDDHGEMDDD